MSANDSEIRHRQARLTANQHTPSSNEKRPSPAPPATNDHDQDPITKTDILRILLGLLLLNSLLSYFITNTSLTWNYNPWFFRPTVVRQYLRGPIHLSDAELLAYDGSDPAKPIYLALNGTIFDVSGGAGRRIYGPGGSYHVFAGKDAARGFVTGCFAEDATPDLRGAEWAYIALDVEGPDEDGKDGEKKKLTGDEKSARANVIRRARKQVRDTIEGWQKTFRGESGKGYYEVGTVLREEGWLEKLPKRKLCAAAQRARPKKTRGKANDAGEKYRGG